MTEILSSILYLAIFIFALFTYFYVTTVAVTFGVTAALRAWMKDMNFVPNEDIQIDVDSLDENDPETAALLRRIRGED